MAGTSHYSSYNRLFAGTLIFNLVIGMGSILMPYYFQASGLILGVAFLLLSGSMAYLAMTFILEAMSISNLLLRLKEGYNVRTGEIDEGDTSRWTIQQDGDDEFDVQSENLSNLTSDGEDKVASLLSITSPTEMGLLAEHFLGKIGRIAFYIVIISYLIGDLAIYAVSVPLSIVQVTGPTGGLSLMGTYRVYVGLFGICVVPLCYLAFTGTKYLQLLTLATRNIAMWIMIICSAVYIFEGNGTTINQLNLFNVDGLTGLFGVTLYSFMNHHSLPGIVFPIRKKEKLGFLFLVDYVLIFGTYVLLCSLAMFAFGSNPERLCHNHPGSACSIQPLFTMNFLSYDFQPIAYFLALFPVFTLSTNYPLISSTLRANLITLFKDVKFIDNFRFKNALFSSLAAIPPIILAIFTKNVGFLASITGGFGGVSIQLIFPALMVFFARRKARKLLGAAVYKEKNKKLRSWFYDFIWIELVLLFGVIGFIYNIYVLVMKLLEWFKS